MTLPSESVTLAGSGLVFVNSYGAGVDAAYRTEVIAAENFFQSQFSNQLTINVSFDTEALGPALTAHNSFGVTTTSYAQLVGALTAHATTADDRLAAAGLPTADPSHGVGFTLPTTYAEMLGLAPQTNQIDLAVSLNNDGVLASDVAVGALEHEISEGGFGRVASLGFDDGGGWEPLDLFRFSAAGVRDFTGGSDGVRTFFGVDSTDLSALPFHNSISAAGVDDGQDLGDWDVAHGDSFGNIGPGNPGVVSATDLQVLDVIGWTPISQSGPFVAAPDDFASSLTDTSHPFGQIAVGGSATGALQQAGDHDLFAVQLQAGQTYDLSLTGHAGGGGTLADPLLQLRDASGTVIATNDDIVDGTDPDSRIVFSATTSGTYYLDAGASLDGYAGTYRLDVGAVTAGGPGQVIVGAAGGDTIQAPETNDTITAGSGGSNYLRGNGGDDSIQGGTGFDDINGNKGNDTIQGDLTVGNDWLVGGQNNDSITAHVGQNLVYGNLGNDTLQGGNGADILRGGQGDDVLFAGSGNQFLSGDRGDDTVTAGSGNDTIHSSQDAGIDRILGYDSSHDVVELDPNTPFTVAQVGADTVITMTGSPGTNEVILVGVQMSSLTGKWIFEG